MGAAALTASAVFGRTAARADAAGALGPPVLELPGGAPLRARDDWAAGLTPPTGLVAEPEVRFLLVHHSASSNTYRAEAVPGILAGFHRFHTGPDKGWPDIAYNFLVDRYGVVWEGRAGSIAGPVRGDATGGSQGFAQLCCFIGDHSSAPPTDAAQQAMAGLLAWLADRHGIDTAPGAAAQFVSLGSNKHPKGTRVDTATIAGHREMSLTDCPGDACFALVRGGFPAAATALRAGSPAPSAAPPTTAAPPPATAPAPPATTEPPATTAPPATAEPPATTEPPSTTAPPATAAPATTAAPSTTAAVSQERAAEAPPPAPAGDGEEDGRGDEDRGVPVAALGAGAAAVAAAAALGRRGRSPRR